MGGALYLVSVVLILAPPAFAQLSALHLAGGSQTANSGAISGQSLGDFYVAFRVHKPTGAFDPAVDHHPVFVSGEIQCGLGGVATVVVGYCRVQVATGDYATGVDITGKSDAIIRMRRDQVNSVYYVDTWDGAGTFLGTVRQCLGGASSCTGETVYTHNSPATIGDSAGNTFDIDFIQWGSGAAFSPLPPANGPTTHPAYGEWKFDGTLTDSSVTGSTLTMSAPSSTCTGGTLASGACFLGSPLYNPIASIGGVRYGLAGSQTINLSAASSYSSSNPNGVPDSFVYSVPTKPPGGSGTLGTPTASTTTMALNDTFGTYSVQLAATDSHGTGTSITKIGVVPENADHTVKYYTNPTTSLNDPLIRAVTGPLTRYGTSAYVDFENQETVLSDQLPWEANVPTKGYTTALPGTVHLSNVSGQWHIICEAGPACAFIANYTSGGSHIWLWWDAPGDHMGRAMMEVNSIISDTDIFVNNPGSYPALFTGTGYKHSQPDDYQYGAWSNGNANYNYYDNALGLLRRYLRTGLDTYLTKFRLVADTHWIVAMDHGYLIPFPRISSIVGLMARAIDGRPEMWAGLKQYITYGNWGLHNTTTLTPGYQYGDVREGAYLSRGRAVMARSAQNSDGTVDTTTRADFCTRSQEDTENMWVAGQATNGSWIIGGDASFAGNPTIPAKGLMVNPWHMAFPTGALILSRELMLSGACDSTLTHTTAVQVAADALASLKKAVDFQQAYAVDSNNGMFYIVNVDAYANGGASFNRPNNPYPGDASATSGSPTVTGVGTTFLTNFLPDGTTYIGLYGAGAIYRVDHATSNTSLTLFANYPEASASTREIAKAESCTDIAGPGLITISGASPTLVTGDSNTRFTRNFYGDDNCDPLAPSAHDCATYLVPFGDRRRWLVRKVTDDQHMTLYWPYDDPTSLTNHAYEKGNSCSSHCSPSLATTCMGAQDGDHAGTIRGNPQLNIESMAAFAYYGKAASDTTYFTKATTLFAASFPAGSYGLSTVAYTGQAGKQFGQNFGAGDNPNLLAYIAVTGPCSSLSFSPTSASAAIGGGTGTFNATVTDSSCDRSVTSSAGWLTCTANCTGTGAVTGIGWSATANAGSARSATLTGGGVSFTVTQSGSITCTYSLVPTSHNYPAAGAVQAVTVTASDSSCAWTATYPDAWLTGPASGTGTQSISVTAAANAGTLRSSMATIAGQPYAATQDAGVGGTGGPSTMISGGHSMTGGLTIQ